MTRWDFSLHTPAGELKIGIAWRDSAPLSPACKACIKFAKSWAKGVPQPADRSGELTG